MLSARVRLHRDEFGGKSRQQLRSAFRRAIDEAQVLSIDVTAFVEAGA